MAEENPLEITELKITNQAIIDLYEWCRIHLDRKAQDCVIGLAVLTNEEILRSAYQSIVERLWDRTRDPQWEDWKRVSYGIAEKWADRDNMGEILKNERGEMTFNDNAVEMNKDIDELKNGEFKDLWEKIDKEEEVNGPILREVAKVKVCCMQSLEHCPNDISVRLLGILLGKKFQNLMRSV